MAGPAPHADDGRQTRQFLAFRLAGRLYALPTDAVHEVVRLPPVARVPQAPAGLLGLANLRGAVIAVASGQGLLGEKDLLGEGRATGGDRALVLEGEPPVALAVDAIDGLVDVEASSVQGDISAIAALPSEELRGAFQNSAGDIVKILDLGAMLAKAFTPRATRAVVSRVGAAQALAQPAAVRQTELVTFEVAGQDYALPLDSVQEVADAPALATIIPHAERVVLGVIGFRDGLLPLLSLRGLLGLGDDAGMGRKVVVARVAGQLIGLVADRMTGIAAAPDCDIEEIPQILAARVGGESRVRSIYRADKGRRLVPVLSTTELFGEEVMRKLEAARKAAPAQSQPQTPMNLRQYVVFRLAEDEFGLPIESVEEVLRLPDHVARLPKAPKFLEGVINLRGEVLPVVDQRRRFGLEADKSLAARRLVVVRTRDHRAGLIVDSVSEVMRTAEEDIAPAPALAGEQTPLVRGVVNLAAAQRLVLLLDPAELLTQTEQDLLEKFARQVAEQPKT